jgi:FKBP-type peptidyl-prolyl cis-trans isomerase FkpA
MRVLSFAIALFVLMGAGACKKDRIDQGEIDRQLIKDYLAANNLNAEERPSGLFYIITREGEGEHPDDNSTVTVRYRGYLLNGTVFDQTSDDETISLPLNNLIDGWRIGIPLMKKGGEATLLLPSALGYGPIALGIIPANSVLVFDIDLVDFTP